MNIVQTPTFKKQIKRLHKNQKLDLDNAIRKIINNPTIGEMKKGDLNDIFVYKFKMVRQLTLLAYNIAHEQSQLILLTLGSHENFYRDLKKKI